MGIIIWALIGRVGWGWHGSAPSGTVVKRPRPEHWVREQVTRREADKIALDRKPGRVLGSDRDKHSMYGSVWEVHMLSQNKVWTVRISSQTGRVISINEAGHGGMVGHVNLSQRLGRAVSKAETVTRGNHVVFVKTSYLGGVPVWNIGISRRGTVDVVAISQRNNEVITQSHKKGPAQ